MAKQVDGRTTARRRGAKILAVVSGALTILGLPSIPENVAKWLPLFAWVDDGVARWLVSGLGLIGMALVATLLVLDRRRERAAGVVADGGSDELAEAETEVEPAERSSPPPPPGSLEEALRRHRDEGARLLRAIQNPLGAPTLYGRNFHGEDVASWIAEVKHTLRDRPADLRLFNYEGPPNETYIKAIAMLTGEHHLARMRRRLRQLDKVIEGFS